MMTALQSKEEYGKGSKKTFAPPAQKLHSLIPYSLNSPKEETPGISSLETEARPNLLKARLKKKEKATTENGSSSGQEKKVKAQDNKQMEKKEKEKSSLTNAEFEEIIQIVLQKSLQQSLGMESSLDFPETSCAQPIRYTQFDKEPGITSSTTDNDNVDGERVMVPHILEISASQEGGVIPEIKMSKPGQPDPAPSGKKFNRLSLSKRKKEAHKKMKKAQSEHKRRQKDQPKKMVQDYSQLVFMDQQKREESGFGQCLVWVQCSFPNCEKWRRLRGNIDPSVLPDNWSCDQNTDLEYNCCDIPEETWTGRESDVAYASYIPGSIIWAKQYGYPWWPGMVESDPDLGEYFLFASHLDSLPSKYHVTFFGETASRAWIPVNMLKNFQELSLELARVKCRNKDCSNKLKAALIMAQEAEQISIQKRVNLFGFRSRYNGAGKSGEEKDLMLSRANSPDSFLEKEEEESELEKEEEEKKDPTLLSPKTAKIQAKKPKARGVGGDTGIADGRDGTQQRKAMKRSLVNEPAAALVLITGRKEVHGNSDPDQSGVKKKFKAPQSKVSVTSLSEHKEVRMVPKSLIPPAYHETCSVVGKEEPGPQEPQSQAARSFPTDDEASSDLDLEQLMEDVGELEPRVKPQHRDDSEFTFFEE